MDQFSRLRTIFCGIYQFCFSWSRYLHFTRAVYIPICMSRNSNRLLPGTDIRFDTFYLDWSTKYSSVQNRTNRSIRALPHFFQVILRHAGCIWCDRSTFHCNTVFLSRISCVNGHLVIRLITVFQSQIIVLCIQINIWLQKILLDQLPEDSCHFVTIHLYERGCHLNLCHYASPFLSFDVILRYEDSPLPS